MISPLHGTLGLKSKLQSSEKEVLSQSLLKSSDFSKKNGVYLKYTSRKNIWSEYKSFIELLEPSIDKEIANIRRYL